MQESLEIAGDALLEPIVAFYAGKKSDSEGRMIDAIWTWNDDTLEYIHDYIQWLFPLRYRSPVNPDAPTVNENVIRAFHTHTSLRLRLLKSLELMLRFYGLHCLEQGGDRIQIVRSKEYKARKANWIRKNNHNYLRMTRILRSLGLLGAGDYANALFACLYDIYAEESESIGPVTFSYWASAVKYSTRKQ